jgi:hypothetical protein
VPSSARLAATRSPTAPDTANRICQRSWSLMSEKHQRTTRRTRDGKGFGSAEPEALPRHPCRQDGEMR